ncbi:MAG: aminotransferase [Bacillota bacterium]
MKISPFKVEEWMNEYEMDAEYNIAETCVESLTVEELLELSGEVEEKINKLKQMKLTYGHITGSPEFKKEVSSLYKNLNEDNILATHGAIGANFLAIYSLVESTDNVVSVFPTYQQLYSIPASFGAEVRKLELKYEDGFQPDLDELRNMVDKNTKLIAINNPNNPSGALMREDVLKEVVEIARSADAYLLSDEVYHGLYQEDVEIPSAADLYEKAVSIGSMSKVFSLAGLRMGWIAAGEDIIELCQQHRDYTTISIGMIDDYLSVIALKNRDKILARNTEKIRGQLKLLDEWVKDEELIDYVKPEAGTTAFLKYHLDISSEEFCRRLFAEKGVLAVPGSSFGRDGFFRIGFAGNREELTQGLKLLKELLHELAQH